MCSKSKQIIGKINKLIMSSEFMVRNKMIKTNFLRKRKLPFHLLVLFMINLVKQSLQKELSGFITSFTKFSHVSKSAFCQQRMKLKAEAFIELNDQIIETVYCDNDYKMWNEFRLIALDGSTMRLPRSKELINYFGVITNKTYVKTPMARVSTYYDLENELILDGQIQPITIGENAMAIKHLDKIKSNDLVISDRGYRSIWMFFYMQKIKKINFVTRLTTKFTSEINMFWKEPETSKIIEIKKTSQKSKKQLKKMNLTFEPFKIRLVKVILNDGSIEVLATSLLNEKKYPTNIFKKLYFKRWGIETNYGHLKTNLEIENFTGKSTLSIKQDFFANIFINNLQSIIVHEQQEKLEKQQQNKNTEHKYKINKRLSLGYMKNRIIKIFLEQKENQYEQLKELFLIEPIPIRPNRKFVRKKNGNPKFSMNKKKVL